MNQASWNYRDPRSRFTPIYRMATMGAFSGCRECRIGALFLRPTNTLARSLAKTGVNREVLSAHRNGGQFVSQRLCTPTCRLAQAKMSPTTTMAGSRKFDVRSGHEVITNEPELFFRASRTSSITDNIMSWSLSRLMSAAVRGYGLRRCNRRSSRRASWSFEIPEQAWRGLPEGKLQNQHKGHPIGLRHVDNPTADASR